LNSRNEVSIVFWWKLKVVGSGFEIVTVLYKRGNSGRRKSIGSYSALVLNLVSSLFYFSQESWHLYSLYGGTYL